jgi:hypothetical protein
MVVDADSRVSDPLPTLHMGDLWMLQGRKPFNHHALAEPFIRMSTGLRPSKVCDSSADKWGIISDEYSHYPLAQQVRGGHMQADLPRSEHRTLTRLQAAAIVEACISPLAGQICIYTQPSCPGVC